MISELFIIKIKTNLERGKFTMVTKGTKHVKKQKFNKTVHRDINKKLI